ncbi:hypothetical protein RIF29_26300 [Crotalaria pallida]|uniref:Uncharacterized protein n=1 Tax=Crotalaria pallida TaxID=3830 RepID=A0AAN9I0A2_CROPI
MEEKGLGFPLCLRRQINPPDSSLSTPLRHPSRSLSLSRRPLSLSSPQRKLSHRHLHGPSARSLPSPVANRDSLLQIGPKLATSASPPPNSVAAAKLHRRHQSLKREPGPLAPSTPGPKLSVWFLLGANRSNQQPPPPPSTGALGVGSHRIEPP